MNIDAVVAGIFRFALDVEFVECTCVLLFWTSNLSILEFRSNPSVVVKHISFKTGQLEENILFRPLLGIHWNHVT